MNRIAPVLLAAGLAANSLGCQSATDSAAAGPPPAVAPATTSADTLVTLKVPNMTCGGCAAVVQGDLQKIDGVVDIQTDVDKRVCRFRVTKASVDYKSKLHELAKTDGPLADCEIQ